MATHYCIGNPCWICYPKYAPDYKEDNNYFWDIYSKAYSKPENKISVLLEQMLLDVFEEGLDEDAVYRSSSFQDKSIKLEDIKEERSRISDDSIEAKLLDRLIKDLENKMI